MQGAKASQGNDNLSDESHENLTSESHKRKYTHRRPTVDYIRIYTNAPPGIPFSRLFEDRREYAYFRWVISRWKRGKLAKPVSQEGVPLDALLGEQPVDVHHTPFRTEVPPTWIVQLRETIRSRNRNGQLVYRDPQGRFGLVVHKNGSVQFWPYLNVKTAWERLEAYVKACWGDERAKLFMQSLHKSGVQTHVAFHTPGVSQFHVKIPGIASIEGDRTPWADGTSEVIIDMHEITNMIRGLEEAIKIIVRNQLIFSENERLLAKNLQARLALINKYRAAAGAQADARSTQTAGTSHPSQSTTPATDSPEILIKRIDEQTGQSRTDRASSCIHGWTVKTVIDNYARNVKCDECPRYNSCPTLNEAYEVSSKQE